MRLTKALFAQHLGWHAKMKWRSQKRRVIWNDNSVDNLKSIGLPVIDPIQEFMQKSEHVDSNSMPIEENHSIETSPNWNARICHVLKDGNVLIYGRKQAQNLTKTLLVNELPENVQKLAKNAEITNETDIQLKNSILQAHLFDTHQEKLRRIKDPERPMWVFPRLWGITDLRKNKYITDKLLQACEKLTDSSVTLQRKIVDKALLSVPFEKDGILYEFKQTADSLMVSKQPIKPIEDFSKAEQQLPDIYPLACNISISALNVYQNENIYPIKKGGNFEHPHTAFVHHSPLYVRDITSEPLKDDQVASRVLLKAFTVAAAKAQSLYGADVRDLPKPITVQCVQVHINTFYFGVYQLNTLNLDGDDGTKNYFFNIPPMLLYTNCEYNESRPSLKNYNNDVLRHALAFYQNQ